jgi:hypothetical protein
VRGAGGWLTNLICATLLGTTNTGNLQVSLTCLPDLVETDPLEAKRYLEMVVSQNLWRVQYAATEFLPNGDDVRTELVNAIALAQ